MKYRLLAAAIVLLPTYATAAPITYNLVGVTATFPTSFSPSFQAGTDTFTGTFTFDPVTRSSSANIVVTGPALPGTYSFPNNPAAPNAIGVCNISCIAGGPTSASFTIDFANNLGTTSDPVFQITFGFATPTGGLAGGTQVVTGEAVPAINQNAYITNSGDGTVSVIDTTKNTVVNTIKVGKTPVGVAATADGSKVYITNSGSDTVSVIDAPSNTVIATIKVGTDPFGVAVTPDGKTVYVANQRDGTVSVINAATNKVIGSAIPVDCTIADCITEPNRPTGIAVTPDGSNVYVGNAGYVSVIATATNAVTASLNTKSASGGVAVTPDGKTVYVAGGGVVPFIAVATSSVGAVGVGNMNEGIAVTPDGTNVYVADSSDGTVWVINTATNTASGPIHVGASPEGVSVTPDGTSVYVANQGDNTVSVINTATNTVSGSAIPVGKAPLAFGNFTPPKSSGATCRQPHNHGC
jgi:YVTN family beta-propeller protein